LWFHALSLSSGLNAAELEKMLDSEKIKVDETGRKVRPKKWDRYGKGKLVPDDKHGGAVDRAEVTFHGSARWFRHPIWKGLHAEPMTADETLLALRDLDQSVVEVLFRPKSGIAPEAWNQYGPKINTERLVIADLCSLATLDVLAVALLLAKRAESISSPELRETAVDLYFMLQPSFADDPRWHRFHPELYDHADTRMKSWFFSDPAYRMEVFITWRGARDAEWPAETARRSEQLELETGRPPYGLSEKERFILPTPPPQLRPEE
jgi:hypothetical protein